MFRLHYTQQIRAIRAPKAIREKPVQKVPEEPMVQMDLKGNRHIKFGWNLEIRVLNLIL